MQAPSPLCGLENCPIGPIWVRTGVIRRSACSLCTQTCIRTDSEPSTGSVTQLSDSTLLKQTADA